VPGLEERVAGWRWSLAAVRRQMAAGVRRGRVRGRLRVRIVVREAISRGVRSRCGVRRLHRHRRHGQWLWMRSGPDFGHAAAGLGVVGFDGAPQRRRVRRRSRAIRWRARSVAGVQPDCDCVAADWDGLFFEDAVDRQWIGPGGAGWRLGWWRARGLVVWSSGPGEGVCGRFRTR